jgi:hypothetical protein
VESPGASVHAYPTGTGVGAGPLMAVRSRLSPAWWVKKFAVMMLVSPTFMVVLLAEMVAVGEEAAGGVTVTVTHLVLSVYHCALLYPAVSMYGLKTYVPGVVGVKE